METLRALEEALLEFAGSVLVISHERWFLDRIATHILASIAARKSALSWSFQTNVGNMGMTSDASIHGSFSLAMSHHRIS